MKVTNRRIHKFFRSENMIFVFILWSVIMMVIGVTFKSEENILPNYETDNRIYQMSSFGVPLTSETTNKEKDADYFEDHVSSEYNFSDLSDSKMIEKKINVSHLSRSNMFGKKINVSNSSRSNMFGKKINVSNSSRSNMFGKKIDVSNSSRSNMFGKKINVSNSSRSYTNETTAKEDATEDYSFRESNLTRIDMNVSDLKNIEMTEPKIKESDVKKGGDILVSFEYRPVLIPLYRNKKFNYPLQTDMVELVSDFKQNGEVFFQPINVYKYNIIKNCVSKCKLESSAHKVLMIVIKSAIRNFENRQAIRDTWGNETVLGGYTIKRVFMLGQSNIADIESEIIREYKMYEDIVQYDFYDGYYNNTLKTIGAINWVTTYCKQASVVLFVDDDYFVSPRNLISSLNQLYEGQLKYLYMGHVSKVPRPVREKNGKWYVPLREFPYKRYPPFINAGSYIMSMRILIDFQIAIRYTQLFRFDDVFLGIVAHKLQLQLLHNEHFLTKKINRFQGLYTVITSHGFKDTTELRYAWRYHNSLIS